MTTRQECWCGSGASLRVRGHRATCSACGSFFDLGREPGTVRYDESYSRKRNHFDPMLGALKRGSLDRWLRQTGLDLLLTGWRVCEVGFGGAACLADLHHRAASVFGIEANRANLDHARLLGVPAEHLFAADALPERLPQPIDLWLFQDSFEHIPDPAAFACWVVDNSTPDARVLLVAPLAGSLSERLAGRWWPHRVPDHHFHWSRAGLAALWGRYGFAVERSFLPLKDVSVEMVLRHLGVLTGLRMPIPAAVAQWRMPFNIGQIGVVLRRREAAR